MKQEKISAPSASFRMLIRKSMLFSFQSLSDGFRLRRQGFDCEDRQELTAQSARKNGTLDPINLYSHFGIVLLACHFTTRGNR